MMRGIYLTVAKSYRLVCMVWLSGTLRRGYCEHSLLAKTVSCRDGDLTSGHKLPRGFERSWSMACMSRLPKSKTRSVGPSAGEVPPSDPESRQRLEILPVGAGDRVFPSSCDSKAT
jgi:hypothetical protein